MRRNIQHLIFWTLYWSIMVYLNYFWLKGNETALLNRNYLLLKVGLGTLFYIAPLAALAYYIFGFGLDFLLDPKKGIIIKCVAILFPYLLSVVLVIINMRLFVFPYIFLFKQLPGSVLFDPGRFFSIMIEAAFPAAFFMAVKFVNTQLAAREREKNLVKEKLSAELQLLKSQLNPHFLFNTLNNIYALTRKKSDLAPDVVMKLSELLSFTLYEAGSETIAIEKEIRFLDDYVALQKIRYDESLSITFTRDIDNPAQPLAPLLLLPLIENAFKHGASENHFDSFININLRLREAQLFFDIENSVEEIVQLSVQKSIGLNNVTRQLELLYKEQKLEMVNESHIFKVTLSVNLNSYGKL